MKESRLGPRQWAFVIVAGGAVLALPFTQRPSESKPEPPVVDVAATLLPESHLEVSLAVAPTARQSTVGKPVAGNVGAVASSPGVDELVSAPVVPTWPRLPHSPFDELVQQKAVVVEAQPAEEVVPMQPLRPWISAPGLAGNSLASTSRQTESPALASASPAIGSSKDTVAMASPWRDDGTDGKELSQQVVTSYGHGRRQLPVTAGPADQYTYEELAQKLNLPKQDLAKHESAQQDLVSAVVPADQVLPIPPLTADHPGALAAQSSLRSIAKSTVVLSRQGGLRPVGAQVRFGQTGSTSLSVPARPTATSSPMAPLASLPEERRGQMIYQPRRP